MFPTFALVAPRILIPQSIPLAVVAPLDVARLIAVTVLPCTDVTAVVVAAVMLMPLNLVAIVPSNVYVRLYRAMYMYLYRLMLHIR